MKAEIFRKIVKNLKKLSSKNQLIHIIYYDHNNSSLEQSYTIVNNKSTLELSCANMPNLQLKQNKEEDIANIEDIVDIDIKEVYIISFTQNGKILSKKYYSIKDVGMLLGIISKEYEVLVNIIYSTIGKSLSLAQIKASKIKFYHISVAQTFSKRTLTIGAFFNKEERNDFEIVDLYLVRS